MEKSSENISAKKKSRGWIVGGLVGFVIGVIYLFYSLFKCIAVCPSLVNWLSSINFAMPFLIPIFGFFVGILISYGIPTKK